MAEIRVGRNQGPQVEELRDADKLRAAVSPQSIRTYDEKRPDFVERPYWGGGKWGQLAQALSQYNPVLNKMAAVSEQRFREEQLAFGKRMRQENKVAWAEFISNNPEYAGLNPHLERGYKAAHLETKAQDFNAALQDHYTTSGLISETDPEKVRNGVNAFGKEWIAANVTHEDFEDSELYAENFYKGASEAEALIMRRHTGDKAEEHLRRAKDRYSALLSQDMDNALANTPGIGSPDGFSAATDSIAASFGARIEEMVASGVPRSVAHEWVENAVLQNAKALGGEDGSALGPRALKLLDKVQTPDGPLSAKASTREKVAMLEKSWRDERRAATSHSIQMWHFNKTQQQYAAIQKVADHIRDAQANGRTVTIGELAEIVPPENLDIAIAWHQKSQTLAQPEWNTESQRQYQEDYQNILDGKMDDSGVMALQGKYSYERWDTLLKLARNVREGGDPATKALSGQSARDGRAFVSAQVGTIFNDPNAIYDSNATKAFMVEATTRLNHEITVLVNTRTAKNEPPPSEAELTIFIQDKAAEIGRKYVERKAQLEADMGSDKPVIMQKPGEIREAEQNAPKGTPAWGNPYDAAQGAQNKQMATNALSYVLTNPAAAVPAFANKFGLNEAEVLPFVQEQLALYGLSKKALIEQYQAAENARNKRNNEDMGAWEE